MATQENVLTLVLRLRDETKASLDGIKKQIDDVSKKGAAGVSEYGTAAGVAGTNVKRLSEVTGELADKAAALARGFRVAVAGIATFVAGGFIKELAETAGRAQTLGTVLNVVGSNAGFSVKQLRDMEKAVKDMGITTSAARQSLTLLIQSGLINAQNAERAAKLARAAQDLAVVSGQNSSETLNRLVINLQQMDTVGLRNMGIVIDRIEAEKEFAQTLGISASALSKQQKQQAFTNAFFVEATKLTGTYEAAMGDAAKQAQSLARFQEELKVSVGNGLLPAYLALVEEFTQLLKDLKVITDEMDKQGAAAIALGKAIKVVASNIREAIVFVVQFKEVFVALGAAWVAIKLPAFFATLSSLLGAGAVAAVELRAVVGGIGAAFSGLGNVAVPVLTRIGAATSALLTGLKLLPSLAAAAFVGFSIGEGLNTFQVVQDTARAAIAVILGSFGTAFDGIQIGFLTVQRAAELAWNSITFGGEEGAEKIRKKYDVEIGKLVESIKFRAGEAQKSFQEFGAVPLDKSIEKATDLSREIARVSKNIGALEGEIIQLEAKASESPDIKAALAKSKAELKALDAERKKLAKEFADLKNSVTAENRDKITEIQFDIKVNEANLRRDIDEVKKKIAEAKEGVGLDKFTLFENVEVSEDFARALNGALVLAQRFEQPIKDSLGKAVAGTSTNLQTVISAFDKLATKAKTPEELALVIAKIPPELVKASSQIEFLKTKFEFELEKRQLANLKTELEGFTAQMEQSARRASLLRDIQAASGQFASTIKQIVLETGIGLRETSAGLVRYDKDLNAVVQSSRRIGEQAAREASIQTNIARAKFTEEINNINKLEALEKGVALRRTGDARLVQTELLAIERKNNNARIEAGKTLFDALKKQQDDYLGKVRESAQKIADFERQIRASTKSERQQLLDLELAGLNETGKAQRQNALFFEDSFKARQALEAGLLQDAKDLNDEQLQLAASLASSAKTDKERAEAADKIRQARELEREILKEQKRIEEERLNASLLATQNLEKAMTKLVTFIEEGTGGREVLLNVKIPDANLTELHDAIEKALKGIRVNFNFTSDGSVLTRASGGPIRGPGTGTSDSILMWGSNGEYVMREAAVRHYGEDFMHRLNAMAAPKFAVGGLVGTPTPAANGDSVALTVTLNGKKIGPLKGPRQQVRDFVAGLQEIERGLG